MMREQFPILNQTVHGKPLVYLDNAATTQKPQRVLDALQHYYETDNANIHRGVHLLSERATQHYEAARNRIAQFIGAKPQECIYVRGTTEAINMVAQSFVRPRVGPGDEILITHMEHHANIVPWQIVCQQTGAQLVVAPIFDDGSLDLEGFKAALGPATKFVAATHISNALGSVNDVGLLTQLAHEAGAKILIDGAQAIAHEVIDVGAIGCDFYAFSGHKMYGPTGIGVLWGKEQHLLASDVYQAGGEMIASVTFEETTYNDLPHKFEAGTPNIAGAIGLGEAVAFLQEHGVETLAAHEHELLAYATKRIAEVPGVRIIGTAATKSGVLSFVMDGIHPHDIGSLMDHEGVAIRTGHHCAQPVMDRFQIPATSRASFACYNTREDVDTFIAGLQKIQEIFHG